MTRCPLLARVRKTASLPDFHLSLEWRIKCLYRGIHKERMRGFFSSVRLFLALPDKLYRPASKLLHPSTQFSSDFECHIHVTSFENFTSTRFTSGSTDKLDWRTVHAIGCPTILLASVRPPTPVDPFSVRM